MNNAYRQVVIVTYRGIGEASGKSLRARPMAGQGLSTEMKVECSSKMRDAYPEGTKFLIQAKVTNREEGTPFLYTSFKWKYAVISDEAAREFIARKYGT